MHRKVAFDVGNLVERSVSGPCFICEYVNRSPGYEHIEVARTPDAVAFLNKYPTLYGYVLIAPIRHLEQVTGDFSEEAFVALQRFIFRISEAVRAELSPERIYILSLGSQSANAHVHWHIAPLPHGVPLAEQQFQALMHEHGVIDVAFEELEAFAARLRQRLAG
jgi:histidine triad (HIT) family protein